MMHLDRIIAPVLGLPRFTKQLIAIILDVALCLLTVWLAFYLRLGQWVQLSQEPLAPALAAPLIAVPLFAAFGLYRKVFRYVGWDTLTVIVQAVFIYGCIYAAIFTAYGVVGVPRTAGLIQPTLLLIAIACSRAFGRYLLGGHYRRLRRSVGRRNVLIYGAGSAGRQLAEVLGASQDTRVAAFVDSDRSLHGSVIGGIRVWSPERIEDLVGKFQVDEVLLAIPSADRGRRNEILERIRPIGVSVRTLPGLLDLAHGRVTVSDLRPLEIEDLLGRDPVDPQLDLLQRNIRDCTVLVTGAGGSIGSELCRQILGNRPSKLLLVEASEFALYNIHRELAEIAISSNTLIIPLLGSVCDAVRMRQIFAAWRPDTVYHAAAYKHVPLVEQNSVEGVRNNVVGTWVCASLANEFRTGSFVLISTDKAVRPTNVMGASKRLAEMVLQALAADSPSTCCSMVRFGNVLGSSGSVVPLFRSQIARGGPITVTHREVTRFFMTISEAAQLVLQAGALACGGEVFVLDMGEPVKVADLAVRMIELAGLRIRDELNPDGDIEVAFTGLRPGEKLYEELLIGNDPVATSHARIMMANEKFLPMKQLAPKLELLRALIDRQDAAALRSMLMELVPEYVPDSIVDHILCEQQRETDGKPLTCVSAFTNKG